MSDQNSNSPIICTYQDSPIGTIIIGEYRSKICFLEFSENERAALILDKISRMLDARPLKGKSEILKSAESQLKQYFKGKLTKFNLPLYLAGTEFQKNVWDQIRNISFGKTKSYSWLAEKSGTKSARAAGQSTGKNPISIIIPCHRVIGSNGSVTGFGGGLHRKKWLLEHEGTL